MNITSRSAVSLFGRHVRRYADSAASAENDRWKIKKVLWKQARFPQPADGDWKGMFAPKPKTVKTLHWWNPFLNPRLRKNRAVREVLEENKALKDILKDEAVTHGNSVSVAQFLTYYGASVRFSSCTDWFKLGDKSLEDMPHIAVSGTHLEAVDISRLDIDYITLKVIRDMNTVTFFNAQGCSKFDDYCLDHITGNFRNLEVLDISDCPLITSKGLGTLYRLYNLQSLKMDGIKTNAEMELVCVLLEEHFKRLTVEGVTYVVDKLDTSDSSVPNLV